MTRARRCAAVASLVGFGVVLLLVIISWSPLRHLDHATADGLNRVFAPPGAGTRLLELVSTVGRPVTFSLLSLIAALLLWHRHGPSRAMAVALTVVSAPLLTNAVKLVVDRRRPVVPEPFAHAPGASMPSGHALASTVGVVVALSLLPPVRRAVRAAAVLGGATVVTLIGFSRLALGVHYVSDVAAGWLLGLAWALVVPVAVERAADPVRRAARTRPSPTVKGPPHGRPPS